jgi:hypothetical protein
MSDQTITSEFRDSIIVTINGTDHVFTYEQLGINFNDSPEVILNRVNGLLTESLQDEDNEFTYTVRKSSESNNIWIYPKPPAGT